METVNFNDCTLAWLERKFKLIPAVALPNLTAWTNTAIDLIEDDKRMVKRFCNQLDMNVLHWNEQDLSMHFIGPMFSLVNFTERLHFNLFAQRSFTAVVNDIQLSGRVDEVIAVGYREPEAPFFAFNEYKKDMEYKGDAAGQALAAMLVGQTLNDNDLPIYGCYVIGRNWFFMILEDKHYAISKLFDGTDFDDACQILRILFQLKEYCMQRTAPPTN